MDLCLMNDRILVEVIERKLSKGGIVLPDIVTAKQTITMIEATVVKTGPGSYVRESWGYYLYLSAFSW
jgi:co-chaperonin GroES (HSP10)